MSALALDAAPAVDELELARPGGGGPGDDGPHDRGGGGGGGGRDDGGRNDALVRLGVILAITSVVTLFATLSMIYVARSRIHVLWLPIQVPKTLWLSTALLVASSAWLESARRALARRDVNAYRERVLATALLGFAFLGSQAASVFELARRGIYASGNPHASLFYVFTGIHAVHLLGGLLAINWLVLHGRRTWRREQTVSGTVALYWHAMDAVWVGLFAILLVL
jgi:cytochrome c oxidase subunit 3